MHFEVEQKFRVREPAAWLAKLDARIVRLGEPEVQVDRYYAHPARDFAQTDEALRIRRFGQANYVTYKGPKLDLTTKTRRELELPLEAGDAGAAGFADLLEALGFRPVAEVRKQRRKGQIAWQGCSVELALDEVDELGTFAELEILADAADLEAAKACLASLAGKLDLSDGERRSYLELLLASRAAK
jgi:adenylate cyclase, class 2